MEGALRNEFGPNQDEVGAMLERLDGVTQEMAMFLATFDPDSPERRRSREAMRQAAARGGRERPMRAAQQEVVAWVNRWFAGGPRISGYGRDITPAEAAANAAPAVLDAVGAAVVADLLDDPDRETLSAPWRELWENQASRA
jgi:hypothetical protein